MTPLLILPLKKVTFPQGTSNYEKLLIDEEINFIRNFCEKYLAWYYANCIP
jgi:hypothetical protein